jgi:hypothetical protein
VCRFIQMELPFSSSRTLATTAEMDRSEKEETNKSSYLFYLFFCINQLWTLAKSPYNSNYLLNWDWILPDTCLPHYRESLAMPDRYSQTFWSVSIKDGVISVWGRREIEPSPCPVRHDYKTHNLINHANPPHAATYNKIWNSRC